VGVRKLCGHAIEAVVEAGNCLLPDTGDDRLVLCGRLVVLHCGDAPSFSRREIPSEL
jgi:hypothetical protein